MGILAFKEMSTEYLEFKRKVNSLPKRSGCYLFKNAHNKIIYIGKAKNLKERVSSYFIDSQKSLKTEVMVSQIVAFDFFLTESEAEALILENRLIKEYSPKYNICLRDDKSYPYIVINYEEEYPRINLVRRIDKIIKNKDKNKKIIGPFVTGSSIFNVVKNLNQAFSLRDCTNYAFKSRKRPCLLYQMNQCLGPCATVVSVKEYKYLLDLALGLFTKKRDKTLNFLQNKMSIYAEQEEFEKASIIRDQLLRLQDFINFSKSYITDIPIQEKNIDVIGYSVETKLEQIDICIYKIRDGLLLAHIDYNFSVMDMTRPVDTILLKLVSHYLEQADETVPDSIITIFDRDNRKLLKESLGVNNIKVTTPKSDKFRSLVIATKNFAVENQKNRLEKEGDIEKGLLKLKELLNLKIVPNHLECVDIAVWQGSSPVASLVVFKSGVPSKKDYRHYNLKELPEGNNDFAMMEEFIERRVKKGNLPNVFIVDGGHGQINVFNRVLKRHKLTAPVIGIAKKRFIGNKSERLIIPGREEPYILSQNIFLSKIVIQMRDEAHRFARKLHHKREFKKIF